jgi:uncharacterized protein (UPF0335 family)
MAHPLLEEFCRASALRPEFFRRVQRVIRTEIQPLLEERERLIEENAALRQQVAELQSGLVAGDYDVKVSHRASKSSKSKAPADDPVTA